MKFLIPVVLLLISQIILTYAYGFDWHTNDDDDYDREGLLRRLRMQTEQLGISGDCYSFDSLSTMISDVSINDDTCQFQFSPDISDYMSDQLIIGELTSLKYVTKVEIIWYDAYGNIMTDDDSGYPMRCESIPHDLGHSLNTFDSDVDFAYARCSLKLREKSKFKARDLFFHFHQQSSSTTRKTKTGQTRGPTMTGQTRGATTTGRRKTTTTTTPQNHVAIITGPASVVSDGSEQTYTVSVTCPSGNTCMWYLDNEIIKTTSNTSIVLSFTIFNVGNRTLSYAKLIENKPVILASFLLNISYPATTGCSPLLTDQKNEWLFAGNMSTPRAYFTATYFQHLGRVLIAGGTSDNSTVLLSDESCSVNDTCCYSSNMTAPRMKHTAVYLSANSKVFLMGGVGMGGSAIQTTELISMYGSNSSQSMIVARYAHATAVLADLTILVVGGDGFYNSSQVIELYNHSSSSFQLSDISDSRLVGIAGHSVTSLGNNGNALIFGGYNGTDYSELVLTTDGTTLNNVMISFSSGTFERAYHKAVYLVGYNKVLITGGHNGSQVFQNCYLYNVSDDTLYKGPDMSLPRTYHTAVPLINGSVLIIGGATSIDNGQPNNPTSVVERYDPVSDTFTTISSLNVARYGHAAILNDINSVFIFGGFDNSSSILSTVEYMVIDYSLDPNT